MKQTLNLQGYGPILSNKETGNEIYEMINNQDPKNNEITIDLHGIKSMATFCAKQIFGRLFIELSPEIFYKNIVLKNMSDDVKASISLGIRYALKDGSSFFNKS